jgi:hypothetical protein
MLMGTTSAGNFTVPTPTIIQAMKEGGMLP